MFPLGELFLFAAGVKLLLGGGVRDPTLRLVLLAWLFLLTSGLSVLVPAFSTISLETNKVAGLCWAAYGALLGAARAEPGPDPAPRPA